jgi:hypothetical protein
MKPWMRRDAIAILGALAGMLLGCTKSPFGDEEINAVNRRTISGQVVFDDGESPEDLFVWLGGTQVSARTDADGNFQISLPPSSGSGTLQSGGVFDLYFYVANYRLASEQVVIQNNNFVFSQAALNAQGRLIDAKRMFKILQVSTLVFPPSVSAAFEGPVDILMTLQATLDSVTVVLPKVVGGLLGGIVLRKKDTGEIFVNVPDVDADTKQIARIGNESRSWRMVFNLARGFLPEGSYEVIPYVLIEQENMPAQLLPSLGTNVEQIGAEYLKIPFKRNGGDFRVIP